MTTYILLAEGFEEIEAIAPYDILKRGGVDVQFAAIDGPVVAGSHGVRVTADCLLRDIDPAQTELIVCPGGLRGVQNLLASPEVEKTLRAVYGAGKPAAAICAGPWVLTQAGILDGKVAVCYPGMENKMSGQMTQEAPVQVDGRVITGRAAGAALDFGLALLAYLRGEDKSREVRRGIVYAG